MSPRLLRWALLIGWVIVLLAVAVYTGHTLKLSTDLRSFMPPAQTPDQKLLMEQIGEGPGSRLLLLAISGEGEEQLAELSRQFSAALRQDVHFSQVLNGEFDAGLLDEAMLPYRYLLTSSFDATPLD
ncbi:MAG: xanthomonadin transporter, partial [Dokdonella sp.]